MQIFGITAETLVAIKNGNYSPIYGISLDSLGKIQKEFKSLHKSINQLERACDYISKIIFPLKVDKSKYDSYCVTELYSTAQKTRLKRNRLR
jgi:hypothetical protein